MEKTKKQPPEPILTLKLAVLLGVAVAFCLPAIVLGASPVEDDFDTYNTGALYPQSIWADWGGYNDPVVNTTLFVSSPNSIFTETNQYMRGYATGTAVESGSVKISFYSVDGIVACPRGTFLQVGTGAYGGERIGTIEVKTIGSDCKVIGDNLYEDYIVLGDFTFDIWHTFEIEWDKDTHSVRYKYDTGSWTAWRVKEVFEHADAIVLSTGVAGSRDYFDNLEAGAPPTPPELRVWGVSPESGTTATSTATNFTIGWEGFDFEDIYTDFVFSFYEENTEIIVGSVIYTPTTTAGTYTLPFSSFGFDKNGKYYLKAKARSPLWEYTAYYTSDLVSPEWWINFNVSGWEAVFEMPEFESWYASTSKFATSTAIFTGITTFLSPIMNKLGEFGNKVVEFLDLEEAYDRGYDLGKIIPTFRHYVSGIEVFFGGFPIIQIFLAFIVILLGVFVVRLIKP